MNRRSVLILALAVAIGLGAMFLSRQFLASNKGKQAEETLEVLVAARDFKEEEILKPDMVKVIPMAKSAIPPRSFTSFKDVEDRWVKTTMLEGDVIVEKKLGVKGTPPGLVANIPKGMRAFAIDVTEQSGVSGFILPGHRVDVLRYENNDKHDLRAETILQNVLVLAAGQVFMRPEERSVQSRTVTLAVKPDEVDILVTARAKGALSLALRGVNDHDLVVRREPKPAPKPAPAPAINHEHEKRLKLEEEKRAKLEEDLRQLKEELARAVVPRPARKPSRAPRILTIYRGIQNAQRIRTDQAAAAELDPPEPASFPEGTASQAQVGSSAAPVIADGKQIEP
jgi:pilus assembly protein CpaB